MDTKPMAHVLPMLPQGAIIFELHIIPSGEMDDPLAPLFEVRYYDEKNKLVRVVDISRNHILFKVLFSRAGAERESFLVKVLQESNLIGSIVIQTKDGPLKVEWDGSEEFMAVTELDWVGDRVNMRCVASRKDRTIIDNILYIGNFLIVDLARKKLLRLAPIAKWEWANNVIEKIRNDLSWDSDVPEYQDLLFEQGMHFWRVSDVFPIFLDYFNRRNQLTYIAENEKIVSALFIFKHHGMPVVVPPAVVNHKILGRYDEIAQRMELTPHVVDKERDIVILHPFTQTVRDMDGLDSWLQTKSRRAHIVKTLLDMLGGKNQKDAEKIYKRAITSLKNSYDGQSSPRVSRLKEFFVGPCEGMYNRYFGIMVSHDGFCKIDYDYPSLMRSLRCIAATFGEIMPCAPRGETVYWTMPVKLFYEKLPEFMKLLADQGIVLSLDGKRVEMVALDVSCDARSKESSSVSSDWFDIAPQIVADGLVLSDEQRDVLFNDGAKIEYADCIKMLDEKSRNIMQILAKIFNTNEESATNATRNKSVMQLPRLRILDLLELRQAGADVQLKAEDENLIERLTNFSKMAKVTIPKSLAGVLRDYQKNGYYWLAFLYSHHFGACLADDMGLGKTVQAIAFLAGIAEGYIKRGGNVIRGMPHLIVMPPTLIFNWQSELQRFYPSLRILEYTGQPSSELLKYDVVVATYDRVRLNSESLKDVQFHVIILDEAQAIKNIHAARTAAARQLKSLFTLTLTGTPLENHIGEYYSVLDVALPGLLPSYKKFMGYVRNDQHESFIKKTRPFILRRTKAAILKDLPEKVEANVTLPMEEKQQKIYVTTTLEVKRAIEHAYETHTAAQANIKALTAILRLRQICISPKIIDEKYDEVSPKLEYLAETLQEITHEGNAALVFSQFTTCLDLVEKVLNDHGLSYSRIDGSTSMPRRKKIVEDFQKETGPSVLLLSLKTGGVGLNLTRANYIFHVDIWWNPAVENQASDRSHRIGQKNTVFVNRLIMHHTIEEKILKLQGKKQKLFEQVLEHAENKQKGVITKKDFDFLLG